MTPLSNFHLRQAYPTFSFTSFRAAMPDIEERVGRVESDFASWEVRACQLTLNKNVFEHFLAEEKPKLLDLANEEADVRGVYEFNQKVAIFNRDAGILYESCLKADREGICLQETPVGLQGDILPPGGLPPFAYPEA